MWSVADGCGGCDRDRVLVTEKAGGGYSLRIEYVMRQIYRRRYMWMLGMMWDMMWEMMLETLWETLFEIYRRVVLLLCYVWVCYV